MTYERELEKALEICKEGNDRKNEGIIINNISQIYGARGDYEKALEYLQQSLAISKEIGDRMGEGTILNNISSIYYARGDYEKALEYLEQSSCNSLRREESLRINYILGYL